MKSTCKVVFHSKRKNLQSLIFKNKSEILSLHNSQVRFPKTNTTFHVSSINPNFEQAQVLQTLSGLVQNIKLITWKTSAKRKKVLKRLPEMALKCKMNIASPGFQTLSSKIVSNRSEHLCLENFIKGQEKGHKIANLLHTANEAITSISLGDNETTANCKKILNCAIWFRRTFLNFLSHSNTKYLSYDSATENSFLFMAAALFNSSAFFLRFCQLRVHLLISVFNT